MLRIATIAVLLAVQPMQAHADDLAEFTAYVETCVAANGTTDALVGACIDERISAHEDELGDLLLETEVTIEAEQVPALRAAQAAWQDYRDKTCAYQAALAPRDALPRELFCRFRLVNARTADVLEGADFAMFED